MINKKSTLIFLHGWATDNWVWKQQVNSIEDIYTYYNLNLPGHGGEIKWDDPDLIPPAKEVLNGISRSNSGGISYAGIGWSLGAQVLLHAAIENKIKFNSLILIGATPCFVKKDDFTTGQPLPVVKKMIQDMKKNPRETVNRFYRLNFTEEELETENAKDTIDRYIKRQTPQPGGLPPGTSTKTFSKNKFLACNNINNIAKFEYAQITTALEVLSKTDLRDKLNLLDIPVLIIHGKMDNICPVGAAYSLAEKIKNAELVIFEKAGHSPFITEPEKFNQVMINFLNRSY